MIAFLKTLLASNYELKRFCELIYRIFSKDALIKSTPFIILFSGVILFLISYIVFPIKVYPNIHDATKSLSLAIVVSGVVTAIINTFTYIGIFQDAVNRAIFSSEFLKIRGDLNELWCNITAAICGEKLPTLTPELNATILGKYLPVGKNFYYDSMYREIFLDWSKENSERERGIVSMEENLQIIVIPSSEHDIIELEWKARADSRTPRELVRFDIKHLTVNGKSLEVDVKQREFKDDIDGLGVEYGYSVFLSGSASYDVNRSLSRKISIVDDPVLEYSSLQFVRRSQLKVRCVPADLKVLFVGMGTDEFVPVKTCGWELHRVMNELLLPKRGYVIFIQPILTNG